MKLKILIAFSLVLISLGGCDILGDSDKCKEDSAIWGEGRQRNVDEKSQICAELKKDYIFTGLTRTGVTLSAVYVISGGPRNLGISFNLNAGTEIQNFNYPGPLRLTLQGGQLVSNNPDFTIGADLGLLGSLMGYDTFELEISEKRNNKNEFVGYLRCSGKYLGGFSLGEQTFEFDLQFDTKN